MAYNDVEISEFDNDPIELYTFTRGIQNWRYTSRDEDVVFESNTYQSISITRSSIEATQDIGKTGLKIKMSRRVSFVDQFISTSPTAIIGFELIRTHSTDSDKIVAWRGRVINVKFEENEVELTLEPNFSSLRRPGLRRVYQTNCPHVLYGSECRLLKSNFSTDGTLSVVNGNVITSSAFSVSINPSFNADWFVGGFVEFLNNGLLDRRFITAHDNGAGTLTLNLPFSDLVVGDEVTAYAGCAHTTTSCSGKFNNILNHGGFPYIPTKNLMDGTPVF